MASHLTTAGATAAMAATGSAATNAAIATFTLSGALGVHGYVGLFDAASGGNCLWVGPLDAPIDLVAGTITVQAGDIDVALMVAP